MKIITFLGAMLFLFSFLAEAAIPVRSCGEVLDRPGGRYKLVNDLECSGGFAIMIAANPETKV